LISGGGEFGLERNGRLCRVVARHRLHRAQSVQNVARLGIPRVRGVFAERERLQVNTAGYKFCKVRVHGTHSLLTLTNYASRAVGPHHLEPARRRRTSKAQNRAIWVPPPSRWAKASSVLNATPDALWVTSSAKVNVCAVSCPTGHTMFFKGCGAPPPKKKDEADAAKEAPKKSPVASKKPIAEEEEVVPEKKPR
jgi:hypothetical protein